MRHLATMLLCATLAAPALAAQPQAEVNATLRADAEIYNGLFAMAVGDQIRRNCDTIDARMVRALTFARGLERRARSLGFSEPQIRAFLDSREEKDMMRAHVERYFAQNGVRAGEPETYCALGRAEIARGSQAGALLRAR